ncbi:hypothetical protein SAMN05421804_10758 [Proteiniclasticum ruminis]|jgi:hypothetical protein|uniref:Uncharacterized protein n=1 Tax=Proteiniclasticum ruminis TaxID=398199 RepID=A0A1G8QUQ4_9CLOT|nr:hypothetical protein SAMN05421804_10758 [Proteiniclasticum ruminis]
MIPVNKKKLFFLALFLGTLLFMKASEKLLTENPIE